MQKDDHERLTIIEIILVCLYLKMRTSYTLGDLLKQKLLNLLKLRRLNDIQNLLHFTQEHDLNTRVEQAQHSLVWRPGKTLHIAFALPGW